MAILPLIQVAMERAKATAIATEAGNTPDAVSESTKNRVFLHLPYHPDCPPSQAVQQAWKQRMSNSKHLPRSKNIKNHVGILINIEQITVTYHQSHNLDNLRLYCNLKKRNGPAVLLMFDS